MFQVSPNRYFVLWNLKPQIKNNNNNSLDDNTDY